MIPQRTVSIALASAMLSAPFIALLYGRMPGLIMLTATLAATIGLGLSMRQSVPAERQRQLNLMLGLNAALLALAVAGVILISV